MLVRDRWLQRTTIPSELKSLDLDRLYEITDKAYIVKVNIKHRAMILLFTLRLLQSNLFDFTLRLLQSNLFDGTIPDLIPLQWGTA